MGKIKIKLKKKPRKKTECHLFLFWFCLGEPLENLLKFKNFPFQFFKEFQRKQ